MSRPPRAAPRVRKNQLQVFSCPQKSTASFLVSVKINCKFSRFFRSFHGPELLLVQGVRPPRAAPPAPGSPLACDEKYGTRRALGSPLRRERSALRRGGYPARPLRVNERYGTLVESRAPSSPPGEARRWWRCAGRPFWRKNRTTRRKTAREQRGEKRLGSREEKRPGSREERNDREAEKRETTRNDSE